MAFKFKTINDNQFHVNDHVVTKDSNDNWVARPPIDDTQLQKAVNDYIINTCNVVL